MSGDNAKTTLPYLKKQINNSDSPPPSPSSSRWITREVFGRNIGNSNRFKWMPVGRIQDDDLSYEQKVCKRVNVLTQMLLFGSKSYIENCGDYGYDESDDEI